MDPFHLERFVNAQASCYEAALAELRRGRKTSHWMWFIFPQIAGLGRSSTAIYYAIQSLDEARAYLDHPVLGPRLRACTEALLTHGGESAEAILGSIDAMKLKSSMTLFAEAADDAGLFERCLGAFFGGARDAGTLRLLGR